MKTICHRTIITPKKLERASIHIVFFSLFIFLFSCGITPVSAQSVLFDFNNATASSPLPISQTAGGITARFSATAQGYSIQNANTMGFTPQGFSGLCLYPSSIYLSDLLISFDQTITDFSIMYSCHELGCDDAATMRVTAYMKGNYTGTNTMVARYPGTWPVDTLKCNFAQGFDSVVVHYDSHPPTCQDYGVIFLADNMLVTPLNPVGVSSVKSFNARLIGPNPVTQVATISFSLSQQTVINVDIYDLTGKLIKKIVKGPLPVGEHQIKWDVREDAIKAGVYLLKVSGDNFARSGKLVIVK